MASTSAGRRGTRRRVAAGLLAVPLLMAVGCSRSGEDNVPKGEPVSPVTAQEPGKTATDAPKGGAGDFGTLSEVCGPSDGKKLTNPNVRGVKENEIQVGVLSDANNAAQPGLGKEFVDMAKGFSKWCNDLGGINGRKIKLAPHDGNLTAVASAMTDACQSDFMVVGGGNPFDKDGVAPRLKCKLGAIPAYVVSEESAAADLQALPVGLPTTSTVIGGYKSIFENYPDVKDHVGLLGQDIPSLKPAMERYKAGVEAANGTVVYKQDISVMNPPGRTQLEEMKKAGVKMLITTWLAIDSASMFTEMDSLNWHPEVIVSDVSAYNRSTLATAKSKNMPPTYIYSTFIPQSLAAQYPVVKQAVDILDKGAPGTDLEFFHMSGLNAWLLFATAVKECGGDLTNECVLAKAMRPAWDAGGLFAEGPITDAKNLRAAECFTMLKTTKEGFVYDEKLTKPNKGIFNCDPANVANTSSSAPVAPATSAPPTSTEPPPADGAQTPPPADGAETTPPADGGTSPEPTASSTEAAEPPPAVPAEET